MRSGIAALECEPAPINWAEFFLPNASLLGMLKCSLPFVSHYFSSFYWLLFLRRAFLEVLLLDEMRVALWGRFDAWGGLLYVVGAMEPCRFCCTWPPRPTPRPRLDARPPPPRGKPGPELRPELHCDYCCNFIFLYWISCLIFSLSLISLSSRSILHTSWYDNPFQ